MMEDKQNQEPEVTEITVGEQEDGTFIVRLPNRNKVKLGDEVIEYVVMDEPDASSMKGDSLLQINNANIDQLKKILPKCTSPMLTAPVLNKMKLSDLNVLAGGLMHFLYGSEIDDSI